MNIIPGTMIDIDNILTIVAQTVAEMKTYGNDQWDEQYPLRDRFVQDVQNNALYVVKSTPTEVSMANLMGFIVVDNDEPDGYDAMDWRSDRPCLVIHRWAVSVHHRQKRVASMLESFTCQLAQSQNVTYLKVDTHSTNQRMQQFLEHRGYAKTGEMMAMGKNKPFYCYDKFI